MFQRKLVIVILMLAVLSACSETPLPPDTEITAAISQSEGYSEYREAFMTATTTLLQKGKCTLEKIKRIGGWLKDTEEYEDQPVYYTFCGAGMYERTYLNTNTGKIFR